MSFAIFDETPFFVSSIILILVGAGLIGFLSAMWNKAKSKKVGKILMGVAIASLLVGFVIEAGILPTVEGDYYKNKVSELYKTELVCGSSDVYHKVSGKNMSDPIPCGDTLINEVYLVKNADNNSIALFAANDTKTEYVTKDWYEEGGTLKFL